MRLHLTNASVFELAEARKRLGIGDSAGQTDERVVPDEIPLERGRHDQREHIVATTMFAGNIDCEVPIHGTIELGIPKATVGKLVADWVLTEKPVKATGEFVVNNVLAEGEIIVDFASQTATFEYCELKKLAVAA